MLKLKKSIYNEMILHAKEGFPLEVCGYLSETDGILSKSYQMTNTDKSNEHFTMDPAEQFAAVKAMRDSGEKMAVVYHSHPESPARPSEEDKKLAHDSSVSYIIISLAPKDAVIKSFRIKDGISEEEEIELIE